MGGRIVPGTKVRWESQSYGTWKEKAGTVIAFVPAGQDVLEILRRQGSQLGDRDSRAWKGMRVSKVDRYLVAVERPYRRPGRGTRVDYYLPKASVVELYNPKAN